MSKLYLPLLFCVLLFSQCDPTPEEPTSDGSEQEKNLAGNYEGFKVFDKSGEDSTAVSLKLEWVSEHAMKLEEVSPFQHVKDLRLSGMDFTYDRGIGEDDCGVITMTGTGKFNGTHLYVIETIRCVKNNGPDKIIEYRVTKK